MCCSKAGKHWLQGQARPCKSQAVRLRWGPLAPFPCSSPIPCPILLKGGPPPGADDSQICVSPLWRMLHSCRDRSLFLANNTSGPLGEGAALASGSVLMDRKGGPSGGSVVIFVLNTTSMPPRFVSGLGDILQVPRIYARQQRCPSSRGPVSA